MYKQFELTHTRVCPNTHIRVTGMTPYMGIKSRKQ